MKIGDKILIILTIIMIGFFSYRIYFQSPVVKRAIVTIDGKIVRSFSKGELIGETIHTIEMEKGVAEIEINQGKIRLLPMQRELCPGGICSSMGWIRRAGTAIICLPNRLVIQLYGDEKRNPIDAVAR